MEQFAEPPAFLPVYRKHLIAGGLMTPDEPCFRELWLYYCRNLHVWGTKSIEWRGPFHRSMPEALAKGLAAKWYPDIPEAAHWRRYSEQVYHPHAARKAPPVSNNPGAKNQDWSAELAALAGASGIQVVRDDREATVLRFEFEPGRVEWVAFNPEGQSLKVGSRKTNETLAYQFEDKP